MTHPLNYSNFLTMKSPDDLGITPGPWECSTSNYDYGSYSFREAIVEQLNVYEDDNADEAQETADRHDTNNAVLISHAPELYAALYDLYLDLVEAEKNINPATGEEYHSCDRARSLLNQISKEMI